MCIILKNCFSLEFCCPKFGMHVLNKHLWYSVKFPDFSLQLLYSYSTVALFRPILLLY